MCASAAVGGWGARRETTHGPSIDYAEAGTQGVADATYDSKRGENRVCGTAAEGSREDLGYILMAIGSMNSQTFSAASTSMSTPKGANPNHVRPSLP